MRLTDLDPEFLVYKDENGLYKTAGLASADGVKFDCPCGKGHALVCWFAGKVPDSAFPKPGRWRAFGFGLADLTLTPSVNAGCWHGLITNGGVTIC